MSREKIYQLFLLEVYPLHLNHHIIIFFFSVFQMAYTTVFGAYSAFLFLRTGNFFRAVPEKKGVGIFDSTIVLPPPLMRLN